MTSPRLTSFEEFWPFYVSQHSRPSTRALHFAGSTMAMGSLLAAAVVSPWFAPAALVLGYGPAWIGHFFFEKNRPATFTYPLWSLRGDVRMYRLMLARRVPPRWRSALLVLVILPFWTSFLVRMYAWMFILRNEGLLNAALAALGLPALNLLYTDAGVLLGQVYGELPFMILPLYVVPRAAGRALLDAAADLGASPRRRLPPRGRCRSPRPGIVAGCAARLHPVPRAPTSPPTCSAGRARPTSATSSRASSRSRATSPSAPRCRSCSPLVVAAARCSPSGGRCGARGAPTRDGRRRARGWRVASSTSSSTRRSWCWSPSPSTPAGWPRRWEGFTLDWYAQALARRAHAGVAAQQPGRRRSPPPRSPPRSAPRPRWRFHRAAPRGAAAGTRSSPCPSWCRRSSSARRWCCCSRPSACAWAWPPWSSPTSAFSISYAMVVVRARAGRLRPQPGGSGDGPRRRPAAHASSR